MHPTEQALRLTLRALWPRPRCRPGGGGGIGIHICRTEDEVVANFTSASRQGAAAFGDAGVFVEKYVQVRGGG